MKNIHKILLIAIIVVIIVSGIFYLNASSNKKLITTNEEINTTELTEKLSINMDNWNYDEKNDIYYQIGLVYCTNPETTEYESLAIYVPGKYFDATQNDNGTYTCTINEDNKIGNYTAKDAPIVLPINTAGYAANKAQTSYNSQEASEYTTNGIIYVNVGCRGKENGDSFNGGAPWGVTDIKAAIRYLRFNLDNLPGDSESIFTFGMSGGGAQSAIVGASGDSELYAPYLESIGAAMVDKAGSPISDSVLGSMCWCPITNLDTADEAYEWNLGQYSDSQTRADSTWTKELSNDLATEYANYINELKLKDPDGNELILEESETGIYNSGSYYDYTKDVIEESLNNFLNDTEFPYTPSSNDMGGQMPTAMPMADMGDNSELPSDDISGDSPPQGAMPGDSINTQASGDSNTTYNTKQEYIDSLNKEIEWVEYDSDSNTAHITNIEGFIKTCKRPTKDVGAFDDLNRQQAENDLFGNKDSDYLHFDKTMAELLKNNSEKYSVFSDNNSQYINDYQNDLTKLDAMNNTIETRLNMYNPMYYVSDYYNGSDSSNIAKFWRINTGIEQTDTSLCVDMNLALALNGTDKVKDVEFTTVWKEGHTTAERNGNSTGNFISWINDCLRNNN